MLKNSKNNGMEEISLVTPTQIWLPLRTVSVHSGVKMIVINMGLNPSHLARKDTCTNTEMLHSTYCRADSVSSLSNNLNLPEKWHLLHGISVVLHRPPVDSPHKVQWRGVLMFSLICTRTNGWANDRDAGDLRCHRVDYDITVMFTPTWVDRRIYGWLNPWIHTCS